jgi:hypothetical protein
MITNLATMSLGDPTYLTRVGRRCPGGTILPNGMILLEPPPEMLLMFERLRMADDAERAAVAMALLTCPADKPTPDDDCITPPATSPWMTEEQAALRMHEAPEA